MPVMSPASKPIVRLLLGKGMMPVAEACVATLPRCSARKLSFIVHDDGTLDADSAARIRELFSPEQIIFKAEADRFVRARLAGHPLCFRCRNSYVPAMKLFDLPLFSNGPLHYVDADIMFTRRFTADSFWELSQNDVVFMQGGGNAYSLDAFDILTDRGGIGPLKGKLNSGVVGMRRDAYDLDYLEHVLSLPVYWRAVERSPFFAEQTLYALLGSRLRCGVLDPHLVVNANSPRFDIHNSRGLVAIHFTTPYRHHIGEMTGHQQFDATPVDVGVVSPASYNMPASLLKSAVRRVQSRLRRGTS